MPCGKGGGPKDIFTTGQAGSIIRILIPLQLITCYPQVIVESVSTDPTIPGCVPLANQRTDSA
jgi:hypothetical protein